MTPNDVSNSPQFSRAPADAAVTTLSQDSALHDPNSFNVLGGGPPADQGLSGLGVLMQLGGGLTAIGAVVAALSAIAEWSSRRSPGGWLVIAALSIARSVLHRSAGTGLLYDNGASLYRTPFVGVRRYIAFAWSHSFLVAAIAQVWLGVATVVAIGTGLALALWPGVLAVIFALPRFRRFKTEIPAAEDRGFEGLAVYNTIGGLGATGGVAAVVLLAFSELRDAQPVIAGIASVALAALLVTSSVQLYVGLRGLGTTSFHHSVEMNRHYVVFAIVGAACCALATLLLKLLTPITLVGMLITLTSCCALLVWPLVIRRFVAERQFAEISPTNLSSGFRRSPDAGLTWIGWLLIGCASLSAMVFLLQLTFIQRAAYYDVRLDAYGYGREVLNLLRWFVPFGVLQAWAGFEMVRMSKRVRAVTAVFCISAACSALAMAWSLVAEMRHSRHPLDGAFPLAACGLALVVPVATWLLVRRTLARIPPKAVARFHAP